jgi:predicted transcriptional regulator
MRVVGALNEYQARLFVAEKALQLGRGGISHLSQLTGMSRVTITRGLRELRTVRKLRPTADGRVRQAGGGAEESGAGRS